MKGNRTEWTVPAQRRRHAGTGRRHRCTLDAESTMTEQVGVGEAAVCGGPQPVLTVTAGHRG